MGAGGRVEGGLVLPGRRFSVGHAFVGFTALVAGWRRRCGRAFQQREQERRGEPAFGRERGLGERGGLADEVEIDGGGEIEVAHEHGVAGALAVIFQDGPRGEIGHSGAACEVADPWTGVGVAEGFAGNRFTTEPPGQGREIGEIATRGG